MEDSGGTPDTGFKMAEVKRANPKSFQTLIAHLKELEGVQARAGWFSSSVYANGMPVYAVAAIQELGATINHPRGTG